MSKITQWIVADAGLNDVSPLRFMIGNTKYASRRGLVINSLSAIAFIGILILLTLIDSTPQRGPSAVIYSALYVPTLFMQVVISATVFATTLHFIHNVRSKKTWDSLRATAGGSSTAMRAAWAGIVYFRLRGPLAIFVYAPRLVLLGFLLWDLTAFRGDYLTLIAGGHQPAITPPLEIPLLGAFIAAAFLLPLSALGLEAAVGLFFATFARSRTSATLIQIVLTAGRFLWGLLPALLLSRQLNLLPELPRPIVLRLSFLANGVTGDWGLSSLNISNIDKIWSNIDHSAAFGLVLLGVVLLQSGLTMLILRWAARRAQYID